MTLTQLFSDRPRTTPHCISVLICVGMHPNWERLSVSLTDQFFPSTLPLVNSLSISALPSVAGNKNGRHRNYSKDRLFPAKGGPELTTLTPTVAVNIRQGSKILDVWFCFHLTLKDLICLFFVPFRLSGCRLQDFKHFNRRP